MTRVAAASALVALMLFAAWSRPPVARAERGTLTLKGRVTDGAGHPLAFTQVFVEGTRRVQMATRADGTYETSVVLGELDGMLRSPVALWFDARKAGYRVGLASGAPRLRLEMHARDDSLGARHMIVRSNDATVTAVLARAVSDGVLDETLSVAFVGISGKELEPQDLAMSEVADVIIAASRPATSDSLDSSEPDEPSADSTAASAGDGIAAAPPLAVTRAKPAATATQAAPRSTSRSSTHALSRRTPSAPAGTGGPRAATSFPSDTCACRLEGTIEVLWDRPLPEPVQVALWLEDAPYTRDSVEMVLGSPRGFTLAARGCGRHRVAYTTYSRLRFVRRTPDPVIDCLRSATRQVHIVLGPVSRMRP